MEELREVLVEIAKLQLEQIALMEQVLKGFKKNS